MAGGVGNVTVLVDNNRELSEIVCVCCAKLQIELINTRSELESIQRTVELLKEKMELNTSNQIAGSDVNYLQRNECSTQSDDDGRWPVARSKRQKMNRNHQQFKIPSLINRFGTPLERSSDATKLECKTIKTCGAEKVKSMRRRVMQTGDSQTRGCADLLKSYLKREIDVMGIIKPGAKSSDILNTSIGKDMSKDDDVVVCAGSNISKNNVMEGLRNILNFVRKTSHTNIIVMEAPYRHDLVDWSCVNKEVRLFIDI
jgi:hypothetical protein